MTVLDDRGRLGGRVSVVDLAAVMTLFVLVPAAIGAYLLFRNPPAKLTGVSPSRLYEGNRAKIEVTGRDLRPFMRVSFNQVQANSFLINTPKSAFVDLPDLAPGAYDVILYDYRQEVDRLPKAFTIMPAPVDAAIELELEGAFVTLTSEQASGLTPGVKLPPSGQTVAEVIATGSARPGRLDLRVGDAMLTAPTKALDLPATVRTHCTTKSNTDGSLGCVSVGTETPLPIVPGTALFFPGPQGWLRFQIRAVHTVAAEHAIAEARVRFVGEPELIGLMKPGDVDGKAYAATSARRATLVSMGQPRPLAPGELTGATALVVASRAIDATVRIPVDRAGIEWVYMNRPAKVGAPFTFETDRYVAHGEIVAISPPAVSDKP